MKLLYHKESCSYLNFNCIEGIMPEPEEGSDNWQVIIQMTNQDDLIYSHGIPLTRDEAIAVTHVLSQWVADAQYDKDKILVIPAIDLDAIRKVLTEVS